MIAMMVKHCSTAEIMALARHLGTPEAQSALQKQPLLMAESMEFGAREFQRIFEERHPGEALHIEELPGRTGDP